MRSLVTLTLLATLAWCTPAQAQNFKEKIKFPTSPIVLGGEISPSMAVTFNHSSHRDVACDTCHHKPRCAICHYSPSEEKSPYASCSAAEGCHTIRGRSNETESRFMAFHSRESHERRKIAFCFFAFHPVLRSVSPNGAPFFHGHETLCER